MAIFAVIRSTELIALAKNTSNTMETKSILIIEDDITFSRMLQAWFTKQDYKVVSASKASEARKRIKEEVPDVVICDLRLPGEDGISILAWIKSNYPKVIVIMMTSYADIQSAVSAIKLGAYDYISKPFNPEQLFLKINEAFSEEDELEEEAIGTTKEKKFASSGKYVQGTTEEYVRLYEYVELVAPTKLAVLIKGESGVGKEHIARMIHEKSSVSSGPFVAVDCGVLSKDLAASDLFGHVKGAFTGALNDKTGFFVSANKGTLFLDEIGNLSIDVQTQLLRALQEKKIKPVGSEKEIKVDVRVITATNEDIEFAVDNGYFRQDLFHRICEFVLEIPPLRESKEDIPNFLNHFLRVSNKTFRKKILGFSPEALEILVNYDWPGNIRELKNIVNRLVLVETEKYISVKSIPDHFKHKREQTVEELIHSQEEKKQIEDALKITQFNILRAAALLNIDTKKLYTKMKLYNITNV